MNNMRFFALMLLARCTIGLASDGERQTALQWNDGDSYRLAQIENAPLPQEIKVPRVYAPDPPGLPPVEGISGRYECPLTFSDINELRSLTVSHFDRHKLTIFFDNGSSNLSIILATPSLSQDGEFVAYRVRIDLLIYPTIGIEFMPCEILIAANRISGRLVDGKRDLSKAVFSDDEITRELLSAFRAFSSSAASRKTRPQWLTPFKTPINRLL